MIFKKRDVLLEKLLDVYSIIEEQKSDESNKEIVQKPREIIKESQRKVIKNRFHAKAVVRKKNVSVKQNKEFVDKIVTRIVNEARAEKRLEIESPKEVRKERRFEDDRFLGHYDFCCKFAVQDISNMLKNGF